MPTAGPRDRHEPASAATAAAYHRRAISIRRVRAPDHARGGFAARRARGPRVSERSGHTLAATPRCSTRRDRAGQPFEPSLFVGPEYVPVLFAAQGLAATCPSGALERQ